MLFLFGFGLLATALGFIYKIDGFNTAKEIIVDKYTRFRELNKLVKTQHDNPVTVLFVSIGMVAKMYWMNFIQWADNSLEKIDRKTVVISYIINGKLHKILVRVKKGPENIILVLDENDNDVSEEVIPYIGHNDGWNLSPKFWKRNKLVFKLSNGDTKTFERDQVITV
jgi:hypothetical protein